MFPVIKRPVSLNILKKTSFVPLAIVLHAPFSRGLCFWRHVLLATCILVCSSDAENKQSFKKKHFHLEKLYDFANYVGTCSWKTSSFTGIGWFGATCHLAIINVSKTVLKQYLG